MKKRSAIVLAIAAVVLGATAVVGLPMAISTLEEQTPYAMEESIETVAVFLPIQIDGKWGLVDIEGNVTAEPIWDLVGFSNEGIASVKRDGRWGIIDPYGTVIVEPIWDLISPSLGSLLNLSRLGSSFGIVGADRPPIIKLDLALVQIDGKWGAIDPSGTVIVEPIWDWIEPLSESLIILRRYDHQVIIDTAGNIIADTIDEVTELAEDNMWSLSRGLSAVSRDGKQGVIDASGTVIVEPIWDEIEIIQNNESGFITSVLFGLEVSIIAMTDYEIRMMDMYGNIVIEKTHDEMNALVENYHYNALIESILSMWDRIDPLSGGLARVQRDGKWGVIDTSGAVIVEPIWDEIAHGIELDMVSVLFGFEGMIVAFTNSKMSIMDAAGNVIVEYTEAEMITLFENLAMFLMF